MQDAKASSNYIDSEISSILLSGCFGSPCLYLRAEIELQYSLDLGETWQLVEAECLMSSNEECVTHHGKSTYSSDVYHGWTRVSRKLPQHTRQDQIFFMDFSFRTYNSCK